LGESEDELREQLRRVRARAEKYERVLNGRKFKVLNAPPRPSPARPPTVYERMCQVFDQEIPWDEDGST